MADRILFSSNQFIFPLITQEEYITSYLLLLSVTLFWTQEYDILSLVFEMSSILLHNYWPQYSGVNSKSYNRQSHTVEEVWILVSSYRFCGFQESDEPKLCMPFILSGDSGFDLWRLNDEILCCHS